MREILFRGKRIDNGEWIYGSLLQSEIDVNKIAVKCQIHERFADSFSITANDVDPRSVGQYTGLNDKYNNKIFEGDIIHFNTYAESDNDLYDYTEKPTVVELDEKAASFWPFHLATRRRCDIENIEVIGNIHEHPELLTPSLNRP